MTSPPLSSPAGGAALLRQGELAACGDGERWLKATEDARRLTLELRQQLGLGDRLLWACRSGTKMVVHVTDPATAAAVRFAAAGLLRRSSGASTPRLVVRLGPPCPAAARSPRPSVRAPNAPLDRLLDRVRKGH